MSPSLPRRRDRHRATAVARRLLCLLGSALALAAGTTGATGQTAPHPEALGRLWLLPLDTQAAPHGPIGLPITANAPRIESSIVQWGIPRELQHAAKPLDGGGWRLANDFASVTWRPAAGLELAQNGDSPTLACATEFDLFVETQVPGAAAGQTPPLSALEALTVGQTVEVAEATTLGRCRFAGGVDYAFAVVGVVLRRAAPPEQTLFYQLILHDTRGAVGVGQFCPGYTGPTEFCVDDGLGAIGLPPLRPAEGPRRLAVDVLPRLRTLLARQPHGLRGGLGEWRVVSVYRGTGLQGSARITTRWTDLQLEQRLATSARP